MDPLAPQHTANPAAPNTCLSTCRTQQFQEGRRDRPFGYPRAPAFDSYHKDIRRPESEPQADGCQANNEKLCLKRHDS